MSVQFSIVRISTQHDTLLKRGASEGVIISRAPLHCLTLRSVFYNPRASSSDSKKPFEHTPSAFLRLWKKPEKTAARGGIQYHFRAATR